MRSHKESSISGTLDIRGAGSYTQSYPQMWITVHGRGFPGQRRGNTGHEAPGSDLSSARSAVDERELVLHSRSRAERRPLRAQGCSGARESARYHRRERACKRVARLDLPGGRSVDYGGSTTERGPHEENISAECPAPEEDARIPRAHEDPGRSKGAEATPGERAKATDCLAGAWGGEPAVSCRWAEVNAFGRASSRRFSGSAGGGRSWRASSLSGGRVRVRGRSASRLVGGWAGQSSAIGRGVGCARRIGGSARRSGKGLM